MKKSKLIRSIVSICIMLIAAATAISFSQSAREKLGSAMGPEVRFVSAILDGGGGFVEIDRESMQVTSLSDSAAAMLGYTQEEMQNKSLKDLLPAWFHQNHQELVKYYHSGSSDVSAVARCWAVRKDTSGIEVVVSIFPSQTSRRLVALIVPSDRVQFKDMAVPFVRVTSGQ